MDHHCFYCLLRYQDNVNGNEDDGYKINCVMKFLPGKVKSLTYFHTVSAGKGKTALATARVDIFK